MTCIQQARHMHADTTVHLRDPLGAHAYTDFEKERWPLTPPPDMNGSHTFRQAYPQLQNGHSYDQSSQQAWRAAVSSHVPREVSNTEFARNAVTSQPTSRHASPSFQSQPAPVDDSNQRLHRRESQGGAIAPSFQIPKSVNDSGGSLSELASQITCLFWFESWELLEHIEKSIVPLQPTRPLTPDAKPTTGFRKWVTTILSTTLVAQNVVILALLFIYRLKRINPGVQGKPGSEYRLLTVALMLGNKFLDDNTYTNKTWAEVSGNTVSEVHIMEVEFLSNMKYCLFTTSTQWTEWQSLLGKFAAFFERAARPQQVNPPASILPPARALQLPAALPSPPASIQASPPYTTDFRPNGQVYNFTGQPGPTPAPSPHVFLPNGSFNFQNPNARKRSYDDQSAEPPPKRMANGVQDHRSSQVYSNPSMSSQSQPAPRLTLPSLSIPQNQAASNNYHQSQMHLQQLPPISVPSRAMSMVYPNASTQAQLPQVPALVGPSSQPQSQVHSQYQSRQQSPFPGSNNGSPSSALPPSATSIYPAMQVSPTYFLRQRDSPYRPVQAVSTLLYPPPSAALQHRPASIEYDQMRYQPLGKPQQRQAGRLPYVSQNMWLDGTYPETMTPINQWPSFLSTRQQQHLLLQQ